MSKTPHIVFHHIPKCGGMSIVAGLAMAYYPGRLLRHGKAGFPGHLNAKAASEAAENLGIERYQYRRELLHYHLASDKAPFISGHYPFCAKAAEQYGEHWNFVTLMRDPVARWYSEYYWNRYKSHDYDKTELDLEAYLETDQGRANTRSVINFLLEAKNTSAKPSKTEVKSALKNLEHFDVIGTLENLPQFQDEMKKRFGRRPVFLKRNKTPASAEDYKRPDENSAFHKKLIEMLDPEHEIYKTVLKRTGQL